MTGRVRALKEVIAMLVRRLQQLSMEWLRQADSDQRGQILVMVAVVFVVLLGASAMALDVGQILWSREVQQNAADAAALAGVRDLPGSPALAQEVAVQYARDNGFDPAADPRITVTTRVFTQFNTDDSLEVTITRTVPPGLRAAVGAGDIDVPAQAVAIVAAVKPPCGLWPFGIEENAWLYDDYKAGNQTSVPFELTYGKKVVLKVPDANTPGNFLAIQLDAGKNGGARSYSDSIKYGGCLPDVVLASKTGNMVGPTRSGVEETTVNQGLGAITACAPCWNPGSPGHPNPTPAPDNVYWQVSESNPYDDSPYTTDTTTMAFGLGCPCPGPEPNPCYCAGPPSADDPFPVPTTSWDPATNKNRCARLGIVPILRAGTWASCNGSCTVDIVGYAGFYMIGLEYADHGNQAYVVGAFLKRILVVGPPDYGEDLDGPVGYFLWR